MEHERINTRQSRSCELQLFFGCAAFRALVAMNLENGCLVTENEELCNLEDDDSWRWSCCFYSNELVVDRPVSDVAACCSTEFFWLQGLHFRDIAWCKCPFPQSKHCIWWALSCLLSSNSLFSRDSSVPAILYYSLYYPGARYFWCLVVGVSATARSRICYGQFRALFKIMVWRVQFHCMLGSSGSVGTGPGPSTRG